MQARYRGRHLFMPRLRYLLYRLLHAMSETLQMCFRRWRNSVYDLVYLQSEKQANKANGV